MYLPKKVLTPVFIGLIGCWANFAPVIASPATIPLVNADFELTLVNPKIQTGFGAIAGWRNTGETYTDSGVENNPDNAHQGSQYVFLRSDDDGAFQISGYQLSVGDEITLTWSGKNTWHGAAQKVSLIAAKDQKDVFSKTKVLCTSTAALAETTSSGSYTTTSIVYKATADDAGKFIGVCFDNDGPTDSYLFFDDFSISVVSEIPEPAAYSGKSRALTLMIGSSFKRHHSIRE